MRKGNSSRIRRWVPGNQKGMVLPLSLIFLVVLSIMGIAAIMTSTSTTGMFGGLRHADDALYNAEAGVEAAKRTIAQTNPNFDQVYANSGLLAGLESAVNYGNGTYSVKVLNNEDDPGYAGHQEKDGRYIIHATGRVAGAVKTLEVVVEPFSRFFYFTQNEEAPGTTGLNASRWLEKYVYFATGDNFDGPVHTNGQFHISGTPVFNALASASTAPEKLAGAGSDAQIFLGPTNWSRTVNLPVGPDKDFGTDDDLDEVKNGAAAKGRVINTYNTDTEGPDSNNKWNATSFRIYFRGNEGTPKASIYKLMKQQVLLSDPDGVPDSGDEIYNTTYVPALVETVTIGSDFNGVIYFHGGGNVMVGGKINNDGTLDNTPAAVSNSWVRGKWTICSGRNSTDIIETAGSLLIEGDVKYVGDYSESSIFPYLTEGGQKKVAAEGLLGLVSANGVWITDRAPILNSGVTIHASIMATSSKVYGSFAPTFDLKSITAGKPLNLMGGIIQYNRGVVGRFSTESGLREGFRKNYMYDSRLYYMTPPSFPVAVNLKMKSWKE